MPVYGNKAGLALALVDAVDAEADLDSEMAEIDAAAGDPASQLAAMVGFDRRLFERGGDLLGLLSDAGRSEPDLAAAYREGRARADRAHLQVFARWPPWALRPGVDRQTAADTYAAVCNIGVYRVLTEERGWSPDQVERWWRDSLTRLLLR